MSILSITTVLVNDSLTIKVKITKRVPTEKLFIATKCFKKLTRINPINFEYNMELHNNYTMQIKLKFVELCCVSTSITFNIDSDCMRLYAYLPPNGEQLNVRSFH